MDERKCLKELNSANRYKIKDTIGTSAKKAFVLLQAILSKYTINDWELNRQAGEILIILKNTLYILRNILKTKKVFLIHYFCLSLIRYLNKGHWSFPEELIVQNIPSLKERIQIMKMNGLSNLPKLKGSLNTRCFSVLCHQPDTFNDYVLNSISNYDQIEVSS